MVRSRIVLGFLFVSLGLITLELCCLVALRINYGYWLYAERINTNAWIFDDHPYMVALPKGSASYNVRGVKVTHNAHGFRGAEFSPKGQKKRIVTIGGSTTYGVDVGDRDTWPHQLGDLLGEQFEVLNLGIPGHGTAEHLYMLGSIGAQLKPDVIILHVGLNDLHCMHDPNSSLVQNRCHVTLFANSVGRCFVNKVPRVASLRALISILQNAGLAPRCPVDPVSATPRKDVDERSLERFKLQLRSLVSIGAGMGARIVIVPQVGFKRGEIGKGGYRWWTPYLDQEQLGQFQEAYNNAAREVAVSTGSTYIQQVEAQNWGDEEFVDLSHLNRGGNKLLANLIANELRQAEPNR